MKMYRYVIQGMVQGVSFRYYTRRTALNLQVNGTVKNLLNGDVEVYAQGEPGNIREFEEFLKNGPPFARVENFFQEEIDQEKVFPDFSIEF